MFKLIKVCEEKLVCHCDQCGGSYSDTWKEESCAMTLSRPFNSNLHVHFCTGQCRDEWLNEHSRL